jgi:ribosomal protein L11 methyltransferase
MAWLSIRLSVPAARVDALCDTLFDAGAQSVTVGDAGDVPLFEPGPGETPLWPHALLDALFPLEVDIGAVRARLRAEIGDAITQAGLDVGFVEDVDWSQTWRDHAIRYCFGGRLWVVPRDAETPDDDAVVLRIDPGLAFGTGGHATTAMCLDWLAQHDLAGYSVIDFGAGSGILGIAALLLGAVDVNAVDHDPQARLATLANATYNGIGLQQLRVMAPDALPTITHDLVLANILAGPLMTLAPVLTGLIRPGGVLVMSGMLVHQLDAVLAHYPGFRFAAAQVRDSWVMVEGTRTGG